VHGLYSTMWNGQ